MALGDHLKVWRKRWLYSHHGIDMGDGTVIHLCGEPFRRGAAQVCRVPLEEFLEGGEAIVVVYAQQCLPVETVVTQAEALLGSVGYDLFTNNCEHFVHYCKTGHRRSRQVELALRTATTLAAAAVLVSSAVAGALLRRRGQA
ncbi:MAG: lecithin retinol acyltransferase family protein [Candidatus Hydrogenedentes bacterium]|nr:lecithin retinol acyltransferase family protein [Candidatus Hydrogenedentota bacterium]MBI3119670.1 lecithin retinol acyltransferase family protein [Candidatus Hydrogenedentota bacterium]